MTRHLSAHPIIFSAPMVRAILDGRKTMTRRVVKPQPPARGVGMRDHKMALSTDDEGENLHVYSQSAGSGSWTARCPYGQPGDRLWVRETFALRQDCEPDTDKARHYAMYRADGGDAADPMNWHDYGGKWKPSIFMPRWASRITLEVTGVRVEMLQAISQSNVFAEGLHNAQQSEIEMRVGHTLSAQQCYFELWDQINAKRAPWASNPWVFVIEFKRI